MIINLVRLGFFLFQEVLLSVIVSLQITSIYCRRGNLHLLKYIYLSSFLEIKYFKSSFITPYFLIYLGNITKKCRYYWVKLLDTLYSNITEWRTNRF